MSDLYPRPVPALQLLFNTAAAKNNEAYAVAKIDPVKTILETARRYNAAPDYLMVNHAYKTAEGAVIFTFGGQWYGLAAGANEAALLSKNAHYQKDKFEVKFTHEIDAAKIVGTLKVDSEAGICAIQGSFGQQMGFDTSEVKALQPLDAAETAGLAAEIMAGRISFTGLPDVRAIEGAYQRDNGEYLVISCSRNNYEYSTLRMFTGSDLSDLREIPMKDVVRYRDGGTTYYNTAEGTLYTPTAFRDDISPKWLAAGAGQGSVDLEKENAAADKLKKLDAKEIEAHISDKRLVGALRWAEVPAADGKKPGAPKLRL